MIKDMIAGLKARMPDKGEAKTKTAEKPKDAAKVKDGEKAADAEAKPEDGEKTDAEAIESAAALARRYQLEAELAALIHEQALRLLRGPELYFRQAYGDFIERPDVQMPQAAGSRFGAIADVVHDSMLPRKQPMVYDDLDPTSNAAIHKEAKAAAKDLRHETDAALAKRFDKVADSAHPIPANGRLRGQWIHHMASQDAYQRTTGKDAPTGIPVLAGKDDRKPGIDRDAERGFARTAFGMTGLPDKTIAHRFRTSPGIGEAVLPKGGSQRQAWVHDLLRNEHASDRSGRMTDALGRAAKAPGNAVDVTLGGVRATAGIAKKGLNVVDKLNAFAQQHAMTDKERSAGLGLK